MKRQSWLGSTLGLVFLLGGCATQTVRQETSPDAIGAPPDSAPAASAPAAPSPLPEVAVFAQPQPRLVPQLIPATAPQQRVPQVAAGRTDPFAAVGNAPIVTPIDRPVAPVAAVPPAPTVVAPSMPQPIAPPLPTQLPAVSAAPADLDQLLAADVPAAPVPLPLASAIEVSGVVQAGDRTSAIVWVPQESTSRYVHEGDYLADGVRVKRIVVGSGSTEPVVILEQDGVEVIRTIGSGSSRIGLL